MPAQAILPKGDDKFVVMVLSLPKETAQRLQKLSDAFGEDPADLASDAIDLFIDQAELDTPLEAAAAGEGGR